MVYLLQNERSNHYAIEPVGFIMSLMHKIMCVNFCLKFILQSL